MLKEHRIEELTLDIEAIATKRAGRRVVSDTEPKGVSVWHAGRGPPHTEPTDEARRIDLRQEADPMENRIYRRGQQLADVLSRAIGAFNDDRSMVAISEQTAQGRTRRSSPDDYDICIRSARSQCSEFPI